MPSFDIVSEVDNQEIDNAINQARKELATRFDLKYGMGGLSHEALMTNIELYGTQVIPRVRELLAAHYARLAQTEPL